MTDSIRAQIIDDIKTNLEAITTGAGYNQTVRLVDTEHFKIPDEVKNPGDFPCIFVVDGDETSEDADVDSVKRDLRITLNGYYRRADSLDDLQTRRRKFQADVEKKIMEDWERAGLAINTIIKKTRTDQGLIDPFAIFEMEISVTYFQDRNDPYSQDNNP